MPLSPAVLRSDQTIFALMFETIVLSYARVLPVVGVIRGLWQMFTNSAVAVAIWFMALVAGYVIGGTLGVSFLAAAVAAVIVAISLRLTSDVLGTDMTPNTFRTHARSIWRSY
jgi:hypothetical protein